MTASEIDLEAVFSVVSPIEQQHHQAIVHQVDVHQEDAYQEDAHQADAHQADVHHHKQQDRRSSRTSTAPDNVHDHEEALRALDSAFADDNDLDLEEEEEDESDHHHPPTNGTDRRHSAATITSEQTLVDDNQATAADAVADELLADIFANHDEEELPQSHHHYQGKLSDVGDGKSQRATSILTQSTTISSQTERSGSFDLHHDLAHFDHLDLNNDEVAYRRARKSTKAKVAGQPLQPRHHPDTTGLTWKMKDLQRQQTEAVQRERQLRQQLAAVKADIATNIRRYDHKTPTATNGQRPRPVVHEESPKKSPSIYEETAAAISDVARRHVYGGKSLRTENNVTVFEPEVKEVQGFSPDKRIRKILVGGDQKPSPEDKTILLIGPKGSGKTSTLNSMLNALYGVQPGNKFRFELSKQNQAGADGLIAYVVSDTALLPGCRVTIVDTPGIPNRHGYTLTSQLVRSWFQKELFTSGQFRLDVVSVVLHADQPQLGWPFVNELATVKALFGDDLKTNVLPIITHAEVLPQPSALRSLVVANIAFVDYYKVNNAGFTPALPAASKDRLNHKLYLTHGLASLERFFEHVQDLVHPLLAVLRSPTSPQ